jgi:Rad3-related DNA helicase
MQYSLENRTVTLSVGEFAGFSLGPQEGSGGPSGLWRAQLGQHWHNELQKRTEQEFTVEGALRPDVKFEVVIAGRLTHRGWTFELNGRIDQQIGGLLREIKSVMHPLPADEPALRADYPAYFLQLAAYVILLRTTPPNPQLVTYNRSELRSELVFVEASSGLAQTVVLTPFDEALVFHQLDAIAEFLNLQRRAAERRRHLAFRSPFPSLRIGQETIQQDLLSAISGQPSADPDSGLRSQVSGLLLFEAPTGYGKTGCVLEFALGRLHAGEFARVVWLTSKSTGQLQVVETLRLMSEGVGRSGSGVQSSVQTTPNSEPLTSNPATPVAVWQVRNKGEHCINHTFHCVRDGCSFLRDCAERWPASGLARFYTDESQPRDLPTLRAAGQHAQICPYEITRAALPFNDVWIGDYNYVFAPDNRGLFFERPGFDAAETLLVIDEAHNLPSRVAGAYSHSANEGDARLLLAELDHLNAPAVLTLAVEQWILLLAQLAPAESLDPDVEAEVRHLVARLAELTTSTPLDYVELGPVHSATLWQFTALEGFLTNELLVKKLWVARTGQLEFTCLDAAAAIGETLRSFGGAILMSATLQPYAEFAEACGLAADPVGRVIPDEPRLIQRIRPTYKTLQAPTPWRAGAYDVAVDLRIDTSFRQRTSHYATTAATIVSLHEAATLQVSGLRSQASGATPCVAVFFPSYAYAEAIQKTLADYGSVLRVALQPKLPDLAAQSAWMEENLVLSDALFLVLGSSFAEGIDLLGGRVTHAMVVGPALPEVNAVQKAKVDALSTLGRTEAFRRVYQIPGLQKVNQALGRLVRAPGQKAKVLLHCRRFADPTYAALLAGDYQMYREIAGDDDLAGWLAAAPEA